MKHKDWNIKLKNRTYSLPVVAVEKDPRGNFCRWKVTTARREMFFFRTKQQVKKWAKTYE